MNPLSPPLRLLQFTPPWQCIDKVNIIFLNTQNLAKVVLFLIIKLSMWGSYCRWGKPFYSRLCFMEELWDKYLCLWTENKCQNPVCLWEEWNLDLFFCHLESKFSSCITRSFIMIFKGKNPPKPPVLFLATYSAYCFCFFLTDMVVWGIYGTRLEPRTNCRTRPK